jgi:hypothetical protein
MKQHEAVIQAMKENGGFATLGYLYRAVLRIKGCHWGTRTPFASIRRIVQTNPAFFRIRPGLWALAAERASVLRSLSLSETAPAPRVQEFNHSYYQGLAVEIGNLKGYGTFVPNQDKNKPFLQHRLAEVATVPDYYGFTYERLLRRARTVDVTWFNERSFPKAFLEIEHSTDIQNSLRKFLEFQDFRINFVIVSDAARRAEVDAKLSQRAFDPIRHDVRHLDYETLSGLHSKISASTLAEAQAGL